VTAAERTHAERLRSCDGYFPPDSIVRRLGNTPLTPMLGGGAAVLLQVAHPLVAVGVADHSDYHRDLWQRLARTLRALYLIAFGTREEAERAGAAVQAVHAHVHGRTALPLGPFPAGTQYSAKDPELQLWVHATLVYASLSIYQRSERQLSPAEQERYYGEMALVAQLFGTPAEVIPPTLAAFWDYFDAQVASPVITVTPIAAEIAGVILDAPLPRALRLFAPAHRLATAAQLPPRLRDEYGLRWTPLRNLALPHALRAVKVATKPALRAASWIAPPPKVLAAGV